jgi:gliding motility-associated-like protein
MIVLTETYNSDSVTFFVPNAFTPNGDGINDHFNVVGSGIVNVEMKIYKRKRLIYKSGSSGFNVWDGTNKAIRSKSGIYNYEIKLTTIHNESIDIEGEVSLIQIPGSDDYTPIKNCSECLLRDMIDPKVGFIYATSDNIGCKKQ